MFSIGLEFSLPKLYAMKRIVFGLGLLQVLATLAVVTAVLGACLLYTSKSGSWRLLPSLRSSGNSVA